MASAARQSQAVQWPAPQTFIELRGGEVGRYLGKCPIGGRHRVETANHRPGIKTTVWLIADNGICRCDGAEGARDWLGKTIDKASVDMEPFS